MPGKFKNYIMLIAACNVHVLRACTMCNQPVRDAIWNSTFFPNLFVMLGAFILLATIVICLVLVANNRHIKKLAANPYQAIPSPVRLITASMVLGIGLGGFADGIIFHQVLQWHEMLSNKIPPNDLLSKSVNMFWDGIFHLFCLLVLLTGIILLWNALRDKPGRFPGSMLAGGLLAGWGLFNIVEGLIDHHLLELHNVKEITRYIDLWNWLFIGFSVVLILSGYLLIASGNKKHYYVRTT